MTVTLRERALQTLEAHLDDAVGLRHRIHADPRVGGEEHDTRAEILRTLGIGGGQDVFEGHILRIGAAWGPSVGIRAELDALPIQELTDIPWRSIRPGVAHLCGHDVHAAALAAVVKTVADIGAPVPLVAVFQPREETYPSGGEDFAASPALKTQDIRAMVAVHLHPAIPAGSVAATAGVINASSDNFRIVVQGTPAHGAYPHLGRDPILAAAAIVQGLQQIVSRRMDPMHPAVVTVGRISGGRSPNAIPSDVVLEGTLRAYRDRDRVTLRSSVESMSVSVAEAHGCSVAFSSDVGEPPLRNDERLARVLSRALHEDGFDQSQPIRSCGSDDFAFFSARIPSLMVFAGVGDGGDDVPGLHHPSFVPDDESVGRVARIMLLAYLAAAQIVNDDGRTEEPILRGKKLMQ